MSTDLRSSISATRGALVQDPIYMSFNLCWSSKTKTYTVNSDIFARSIITRGCQPNAHAIAKMLYLYGNSDI